MGNGWFDDGLPDAQVIKQHEASVKNLLSLRMVNSLRPDGSKVLENDHDAMKPHVIRAMRIIDRYAQYRLGENKVFKAQELCDQIKDEARMHNLGFLKRNVLDVAMVSVDIDDADDVTHVLQPPTRNGGVVNDNIPPIHAIQV